MSLVFSLYYLLLKNQRRYVRIIYFKLIYNLYIYNILSIEYSCGGFTDYHKKCENEPELFHELINKHGFFDNACQVIVNTNSQKTCS